MGELEPDVASANDDKAPGQGVEFEQRGVGESLHGRRQENRALTARPPTLMKKRSASSSVVADLDRIGGQKARMAFDERAVGHTSQPGLEVRAGVADNLIHARHHGGEVDADWSDVHAKISPAPREVSRIGAGDQRLGRGAAGVDACAADELAFDQRNLLPADASRPAIAGPA